MPRFRTSACALAIGVIAVAAASAAPAPPSGGWIVYPTYGPTEAGAQILSTGVRGRHRGRHQRLLLSGTGLAAGVALSRDGKRLSFVRKGSRGPAVWVARSDGRGQRRLAAGSHPAWSPDARRLVFLSTAGLMTVQVDGSGLRKLVEPDKISPVQPVWSPTGGWIAYQDESRELWIVRPDDKRSRRLATIARSYSKSPFCWSPDGRRLAYLDSTGHFSIVSVGGGSPKRLKVGGLDPQWSPNGRLISFTDNGTTHVIRADRPSPPRFVAGGETASWSPDGSKLAIVVGNQVWVARLARRGPWRVSRGAPFSEFSGVSGRPAWTPDGRRIFFSREHLDPGHLMIISAEGDRRRRLTPLNRLAESDPTWSPDGRTVAFTGTDESERGGSAVYLIQADGTRMRRLTPGRPSTAQPAWSPDGKRIAFMKWVKPQSVVLYSMPAAGGQATRIAPLVRGNPAWAPGQSIALDGIDLLSPEGEFGGQITQPPQWGYDHEPDWAPDGRHFAFSRVPKGCRQCDVNYLAVGELGSSTVQQTTAEVTSPRWSPDGTRIAAVTYGDGVLVTMRPDGSDVQIVGARLLGEFDQGVEIDWGPGR